MALFPRPNYTMIAAILLWIGSYLFLRLVGFGILEIGLALFFTVLGIGCAVDYFRRRKSEDEVSEYQAANRTEDVQLMEIYSRMTPEQIAALAETKIVWRHVYPAYGEATHTAYFPRGMNQPAEAFSRAEVLAVWGVCDEFNFAPLSTWTEGTRNRHCAQAMYEYFIRQNLLLPWNGNQPACWKEGKFSQAARELFGGEA